MTSTCRSFTSKAFLGAEAKAVGFFLSLSYSGKGELFLFQFPARLHCCCEWVMRLRVFLLFLTCSGVLCVLSPLPHSCSHCYQHCCLPCWPDGVQCVCQKCSSSMDVGSVLALTSWSNQRLLLTSSARTACKPKESVISWVLVVHWQVLKCRGNLILFWRTF